MEGRMLCFSVGLRRRPVLLLGELLIKRDMFTTTALVS